MRPRIWHTAMSTFLALTLTFALSGCQGHPMVSSKVDYCTIMADPPVKDGSHLDGPGRYRCDGKGADTLKITVFVQKNSSSGWRTIATQSWTVHGANTTRLRSETTRTRNLVVKCATGTYRTLVHSWETSGKVTERYDTRSVPVPNPCKL
jgi:hypothetical protein